jgi:hypothetical protein
LLRLLLSFRNAVDFPLRQFFQWKRGKVHLANQDKTNLFENLPQVERPEAEKLAISLFRDFHLNYLFAHSTTHNYCINLYYLDLLVNAFSRLEHYVLPSVVGAVDIGVSDWFYVQAYHAFLKYWQAPPGRTLSLTGYEADAYRVYYDLHSRYDYALSYSNELEGVIYRPERFQRQSGKYDLVSLFFPFIFRKDHLLWGLPGSLYDPGNLFLEAWQSTKPEGIILIVNQGPDEHQTLLDILKNIHIQPEVTFEFNSIMYQYDISHFVTLIKRHG